MEGNVLPTLGACNDGTDRNHQDIHQSMFHLTRTAGVIEFGELLNQLLDQREGLFKKRLAYSNALNPHPLRRNFMREPWGSTSVHQGGEVATNYRVKRD